MSIKIGHASIDENGKGRNGKSGDQSGKEVCIRTWYQKGWQFVLRCKDPVMADNMAKACEAGCANSNIGYDMNQRNTAHTEARKVGYDLSKIKTPCETDCSAFLTLCAIAAGITSLEYSDNAPTTSTMKTAFLNTGKFEVLTDPKYLTSDKYLKRGDILVKPGSHTVMALEDGSMVRQDMARGIDVSSYQGNIDWKKVSAAGVDFAILKIIRKDLNPDKQFENNWNGATEAGIPVQGVYNYSYATTVKKAGTDAKKVLEVLNGRKVMVWLDLEDNCLRNIGRTLMDVINKYEEVIKGGGCSFGVCTGIDFYNSYIKKYSGMVDCPFWIARYPSKSRMKIADSPLYEKKPEISHKMYGWQYSQTGCVPGINANVDLDELYVAVETSNVMPGPDKTAHRVGESIRVSSYYESSNDPIEKANIRENSGVIMRIKPESLNPYCFGRNGVAIGWCNNGDIRSSGTGSEIANTYIIKPGDTLSAIAKKFHTTVEKLQKDNGIKNINKIYVGQKIKI